jgi:hypothetical protein
MFVFLAIDLSACDDDGQITKRRDRPSVANDGAPTEARVPAVSTVDSTFTPCTGEAVLMSSIIRL